MDYTKMTRYLLASALTSIMAVSAVAQSGSVPPKSIRPSMPVPQGTELMTWSTGVAYSYDGAGNIRAMGSDSFVYDAAGRLVQSDLTGTTTAYGYDSFGNRTACSQAGGDCQYGYTIDSSTNRIGSSVANTEYDAAGNLIKIAGHTIQYDALSMQTRDAGPAATREYVYTADDERLAVYTPGDGRWNWTVRDTSGKVLRELTSQNPTTGTLGSASWQWRKDYVWRDGALLASRQIDPYSGAVTTYHYHLDHLGTPRRITDEQGRIIGIHDYYAFGTEKSTGTNEPSLTPLKFTGHERDSNNATGPGNFDYMHARYYDAAMGRFLSPDPELNLKRNLPEPQRWNRYVYAVSNPVRNVDADGRTDNDFRCYECTSPEMKAAFRGGLTTGLKYGGPIVAATTAAVFAPEVAMALAVRYPTTFGFLLRAGAAATGAAAAPEVNVGSGSRPIAGMINVDNLADPTHAPGVTVLHGVRGVVADGLSAFRTNSVGNVTAQNLPSTVLGLGGRQFASDLGRTMQSGYALNITTNTPGALKVFAKLLEKEFTDIVIEGGHLMAVRR